MIGTNETKLESSIHQQITDISGDSQQCLDRSQFGGGVSIYVRNTIIFINRKDVPLEDLELLYSEVQLPNAGNSWSLRGIDNQTARLLCSTKLKKFYHNLIRKAKR